MATATAAQTNGHHGNHDQRGHGTITPIIARREYNPRPFLDPEVGGILIE